MKAGNETYEYKNCGIRVFDTRGQILLDEKESAHLNLMLEVIFRLNCILDGEIDSLREKYAINQR
jgi:hypothetical protein